MQKRTPQIEVDRVRYPDGYQADAYGVYLRSEQKGGYLADLLDERYTHRAALERAQFWANAKGGLVILDTTNTELVRTPGA